MAVSRTMWLKGLREDLSKWMRAAAIDKNEETKAISLRWKNGFQALKVENDQAQEARDEKYKADIAAARADYNARLAQGPPAD